MEGRVGAMEGENLRNEWVSTMSSIWRENIGTMFERGEGLSHEDLVRGPQHHPSLAGPKITHRETERPS